MSACVRKCCISIPKRFVASAQFAGSHRYRRRRHHHAGRGAGLCCERRAACGGFDPWLFTVQGSMPSFAQTEAERERADDRRPSVEAHYASREAWAARLAAAVDRLVAELLLLADDGTAWRPLCASRRTCTRRYRNVRGNEGRRQSARLNGHSGFGLGKPAVRGMTWRRRSRFIVIRFIRRRASGSNGVRRCIVKPSSHKTTSPTWHGCA
jgi:hypothetical protein